MTFTSTPPTTPGFYAWKSRAEINDIDAVVLKTRWQVNTLYAGDVPVTVLKGVWCRLLPAEEVEKAYIEGHYHCSSEIIEAYDVKTEAAICDWHAAAPSAWRKGLKRIYDSASSIPNT
jgi:hypothetical protein